MVDIWTCYRAVLGVSILSYLQSLGCVLIYYGTQLTGQIGPVVENSFWYEDIMIKSENLSASQSAKAMDEEVPSEATEIIHLNWPPILFKSSSTPDRVYQWPKFTADLLIGVGVFAMMMSWLGAFIAYKKTPFFITLFIALMTIFVLIQFLFAFLHFSTDLQPLQKMREDLRQTLLDEYEIGAEANNQFTLSLNTVMLAWNCCGVAGPADFLAKDYTYVWSYTDIEEGQNLFENRTHGNSSKPEGKGAQFYHRPVKFPLACCKQESRERGFAALLDCAASGDEQLIYNKGCFPTVADGLFRAFGDRAVDAFIYIIAIEVLLIIMVTILTHMPRDFEYEATRQAIDHSNTVRKQTLALIDQATEENEAKLNAMVEMRLKVRERPIHVPVPEKTSSTELHRRHVFVPYAKRTHDDSSSSSETDESVRVSHEVKATQIW